MPIQFVRPVLCAGLIYAALTSHAALAAPVSVTCAPTKMRIMASSLPNTNTTNTTFKTVPEAIVTFTQGGTSPSCVVVRFSAETNVPGGAGIGRVRALLDNVTAAVPDEVQFSGADIAGLARAYDFVFPSVAPGSHVLRMQFRSSNGQSVFLDRHTTIVQHAP
jgi:hypothetical protein